MGKDTDTIWHTFILQLPPGVPRFRACLRKKLRPILLNGFLRHPPRSVSRLTIRGHEATSEHGDRFFDGAKIFSLTSHSPGIFRILIVLFKVIHADRNSVSVS